jgi:hypothetical protein
MAAHKGPTSLRCDTSLNHKLYASFVSGSAALKMGKHFYICGREVWMSFTGQK